MKWIYGTEKVERIALTRKFVEQKRPQVGHFEFDQVEIFHGISLP